MSHIEPDQLRRDLDASIDVVTSALENEPGRKATVLDAEMRIKLEQLRDVINSALENEPGRKAQ